MITAIMALLVLVASALPASAASGSGGATGDAAGDAAQLSGRLVRASTAGGAMRFLREFQRIAGTSGGTRAAGTEGFDRSAAYVYGKLKAAGYRVSYEPFTFTYTGPAAQRLTITDPERHQVPVSAVRSARPTPKGGVTARVAATPEGARTGCAAGDYAAGGRDHYRGAVVLAERGGCDLSVKQRAAAGAGAVALLVYNNVDGPLTASLGDPSSARIPVGAMARRDGEKLAREAARAGHDGRPAVRATLDVREVSGRRTTRNVIAETPGGDAKRTVMLGAHLDSVPAGPGINDNGSGSAGLLDVALALAHTHARLAHRVRFAWWSAEEFGLLGSRDYVGGLSAAQRRDIALYLNFDMIASPNPAELVYDGDGSDPAGTGPGPTGSAALERGITSYLDHRGVPHQPTQFDARSDYEPFLLAGIPAGGAFTGAEGIKTRAEAARYGGRAGVPYDPCYHRRCDDLSNVDTKALDTNIDVVANAVGRYAQDLKGVVG
ncbi:M28 family metallopeptidase [Streptomyces fuscigenes]|uniref:M28 family metallopeptidase n=1 Tax=Streptomyces fuscigenes TaxID=1528880 RepID=UPI001F40C298|nr:M28 family metallopeptidase [Streptomyces fuscigenes]MCF3960780.1 M28 family metallopeptidase [Streptomyces fuscigenes]